MRDILIIAGVYLVFINLVTFGLFGFDKHNARHHRTRIPVAVLMLFAVIGGALGGYIAMQVYHHKTNNPQFYYGLPIMILVYLIAIFYLLIANADKV